MLAKYGTAAACVTHLTRRDSFWSNTLRRRGGGTTGSALIRQVPAGWQFVSAGTVVPMAANASLGHRRRRAEPLDADQEGLKRCKCACCPWRMQASAHRARRRFAMRGFREQKHIPRNGKCSHIRRCSNEGQRDPSQAAPSSCFWYGVETSRSTYGCLSQRTEAQQTQRAVHLLCSQQAFST